MPARPKFITSEAALREKLKAPGDVLLRKIRPELEATGRAWISRATMVGLCRLRSDGLIDVSARALKEGPAITNDNHVIQITDQSESKIGYLPEGIELGEWAGSIYMLPGINETLRANGKLRLDLDRAALKVEETYIHCPKAFLRGGLWQPEKAKLSDLAELTEEHGPVLGPSSRKFMEHAPFMLMGTALTSGGADLSPRGDPAGFLNVIDNQTLIIPDRPGNHIADSFRNIIENPVIGLLVFIPGFNWTLNITGEAHIIDDEELLKPMTERGRAPTLGIWLDIKEVHLVASKALDDAGIWDTTNYLDKKSLPSAGRALAEQMEPNGKFIKAKGWLFDKILSRDAKKNLY